MRKYTTPNLKITLKKRNGTPLIDVPFVYVLFTLKGKNNTIEKKIDYSDVEEGAFEVQLTQEETATFVVGEKVEAECNIIFANGRSASSIKYISITKNLHDEIILT